VQMSSHRAHSAPSFLFSHLQCLLQGIGQPFGIVRINDQGIGQFVGCACHLTDQQHTVLIQLGRDLLLGHQVHPVVYGTDQREVRHSVVRDQRGESDPSLQILDRVPASTAMARVDL